MRTSRILRRRDDGLDTGTFYIGDRRKGGVTGRVYDKQAQLLEVEGITVPPRVRYEVTVKRTLPVTMRDAALPTELFWHVASPSLLQKPSTVHNWVPSSIDDLGWTQVMHSILPYERLRMRLETSPDIAELVRIADELGPHGLDMLCSMFERQARSSRDETSSPNSKPASPEKAA